MTLQQRQVKVSLEGEPAKLIDALTYLKGKTAAEMVLPVVVAWLEEHRDDPGMAEALKGRQVADDADRSSSPTDPLT